MGDKYVFDFLSGQPLPLGATVMEQGVNFALFSRNADAVTLVIYETDIQEMPLFRYELHPEINKTGDVWHCFVKGLKEGFWYGYLVDGPYEPKAGHRFNQNKLLLDPYARAVSIIRPLNLKEMFSYEQGSEIADLSFSTLHSDRVAPRACIVKTHSNWSVKHNRRKLKDQIIYELHVKGFTNHSNSNVEEPGTFKGIIAKIPYLKELGVTALELLPIHAFDDNSTLRHSPKQKPLTNYWGYDPVSYSSLHLPYASTQNVTESIKEFKNMVTELHKAEIDVILDVVFNHSGEGSELGPTFSFRGIDNSIYYMLDNGRGYKNYTGCGNTMNCNHPVVRDMIMDSLLYWVVEMGVDGFRFDLASVFSRDGEGNVINYSPLIEKIAEHPVLRDIIIIAESWDAGGAYQVGKFGGIRWAEWNGAFRDGVRSFLKADYGSLADIAERLTGSPRMFMSSSKFPSNSINFITCHDGFTLNDLVSYNQKHNEDNGENNRDGYDDNRSWNCGVEGPTDDPKILKLRQKQMKNAVALMMLSLGVPMITAGDEFCRTQKGNNNAYCQDNEISWIDWSLLDKNADFFNFVKKMISFRKHNPALRRRHFYDVLNGEGMDKFCDITWYGEKGGEPDWSDRNYNVGLFIKGWIPVDGHSDKNFNDIFVILNSHWESHNYILPKIKDKKWYLVCDTDKETSNETVVINDYVVQPRSVVILVAKDIVKKEAQ